MNLGKLVRMGAAAGAFIFTVHANAADLNSGYSGFKDGPSAAPVWSGFYAGINGGGAWRDSDDQFAIAARHVPTAYAGGFGFPPSRAAYGGLGADGGFGGGQIGYDWQGVLGTRQLVVGIETDFQGGGVSNKSFDVSGDAFKMNVDWFGTVRGRLGYAPGSTLFYFTGGFAYGHLTQSAQDTNDAFYKSSTTATGYVLGGGLEYKFHPSWSVKAEYQYLNFGKKDAGLGNPGSEAPGTASLNGFKITDDAYHTVRIGMNYWISSAYVPLK